MSEGRSLEIGYINIPKRNIGDKDVIDVKDVLDALNGGIKQDIPGESKVIEGKFSESANTEEESSLVTGFERLSKSIEKRLNNFFGFYDKEEVKETLREVPEKVKKDNVIKVDFSKNK